MVHPRQRPRQQPRLEDAIFDAGVSNLSTAHIDIDELGIAIDLLALDRPLNDDELRAIDTRAGELTGVPGVVTRVRQIVR